MPPEPKLVHDPLLTQQLANQTGLQLAVQLAMRIWDGGAVFSDAMDQALDQLVRLEAAYPQQLQQAVLRFKAEQEREARAAADTGEGGGNV